jgi:GATA zinc finger
MLRNAIESHFGLEILLKHDELRLINQEMAKCQIALEQLRRCHLISSSTVQRTQSDELNTRDSHECAIIPHRGAQRPIRQAARRYNYAFLHTDGHATTVKTCQNCTTSTTPLWRHDKAGLDLCNACALFLKLYGRARPIHLQNGRNGAKTPGQGQVGTISDPFLQSNSDNKNGFGDAQSQTAGTRQLRTRSRRRKCKSRNSGGLNSSMYSNQRDEPQPHDINSLIDTQNQTVNTDQSSNTSVPFGSPPLQRFYVTNDEVLNKGAIEHQVFTITSTSLSNRSRVDNLDSVNGFQLAIRFGQLHK